MLRRKFLQASSGRNRIPELLPLLDTWTTQGSWDTATGGVTDPAAQNVESYLAVGYTGDFEL